MLKRAVSVAFSVPAGLAAWFALSPVPGAYLIRWLFQADAAKTKKAMAKHTAAGISVERGMRYGTDSDALFDVYRQMDIEEAQPAVVWVHGGAWLSGHRDDAAPYFTLLAEAGFTVVSVGYSRAPGARYPVPVRQVNEALFYLVEHADRFAIDPGRIALGGDSAGAQISSQVAAMVTDPEFAGAVGITPGLAPQALRAIVLYCGIYDLSRFLNVGDLPSMPLRWGVRETVRAYTRSRSADTTAAAQMSTLDHVTPHFPSAFISGGNGDRLTDTQSRLLVDALRERAVEVDTLFFSADQTPALPHEYQYNLDTEQGQEALRKTVAFLRANL